MAAAIALNLHSVWGTAAAVRRHPWPLLLPSPPLNVGNGGRRRQPYIATCSALHPPLNVGSGGRHRRPTAATPSASHPHGNAGAAAASRNTSPPLTLRIAHSTLVAAAAVGGQAGPPFRPASPGQCLYVRRQPPYMAASSAANPRSIVGTAAAVGRRTWLPLPPPPPLNVGNGGRRRPPLSSAPFPPCLCQCWKERPLLSAATWESDGLV